MQNVLSDYYESIVHLTWKMVVHSQLFSTEIRYECTGHSHKSWNCNIVCILVWCIYLNLITNILNFQNFSEKHKFFHLYYMKISVEVYLGITGSQLIYSCKWVNGIWSKCFKKLIQLDLCWYTLFYIDIHNFYTLT